MKKTTFIKLAGSFLFFLLLPLAASANCMWSLNNKCEDIGTTNNWILATKETFCSGTKPNGQTAKCCCANGDIPGCCEKKDTNGVITTANMTGENCQAITSVSTTFYQDKEADNNTCVKKGSVGCAWNRVVTNGQTTATECSGDKKLSGDDRCPAPKPADTTNAHSSCCCPAPVDKPGPAATPPKFIMPELQIPIPGLSLTKTSAIKYTANEDGSYQVQIPWLSEYILAIYKYGLSIAGILAALILMAGGALWLVSGGDASRVTQAKELIAGSVTGLIILFSSYIILIQINPDLVQLKPITIGTIQGVDLVSDGSDSQSNLSSTASCLSDADLVNITGIVNTSRVSDPRLSKNAYEGLKKAIAEAKKQGVELTVTSANRSYAKQKSLWDAELKKFNGDTAKTRKYVADPANCTGNKCYSHCAGVAIDVCIKGSKSCGMLSSAYASNNSDPDIIKLQSIMKAAGWLRYCGEWWHFQYGLAPGKSCSP